MSIRRATQTSSWAAIWSRKRASAPIRPGRPTRRQCSPTDIIFGAGGNTGNGALQEVAKASGAGTDKFCIGVDTDQWDTVPAAQPCLVTSAMKLITEGVTETAVKAKDGDFAELQTLGKAGLAPFHDFDSVVPAEVKTKVVIIIELERCSRGFLSRSLAFRKHLSGVEVKHCRVHTKSIGRVA